MTRPTSESREGLAARLRGAALDLTPLRVSPPFRRLLAGDAVSVIGTQVTTVAVPLQVYAETRSAAAVELAGLVLLSTSGQLRRRRPPVPGTTRATPADERQPD